jgi:4-amino-4-deoxy-L-arabinose transferase-like glycosyltransferase
MSVADFETYAMNITLTIFMLWMCAIIWKLGKESGGGKWAYIALFLALGLGFVGFIAKIVLVEFVLNVE